MSKFHWVVEMHGLFSAMFDPRIPPEGFCKTAMFLFAIQVVLHHTQLHCILPTAFMFLGCEISHWPCLSIKSYLMLTPCGRIADSPCFLDRHFVWYRGCFSLAASIYVNSGLISTVYAFFFSWFHMEQLALLFWMRPLDLKHEASSLIRGAILAKKWSQKNRLFYCWNSWVWSEN